nr:cell division protein [Palmellopsis texensis]
MSLLRKMQKKKCKFLATGASTSVSTLATRKLCNDYCNYLCKDFRRYPLNKLTFLSLAKSPRSNPKENLRPQAPNFKGGYVVENGLLLLRCFATRRVNRGFGVAKENWLLKNWAFGAPIFLCNPEAPIKFWSLRRLLWPRKYAEQPIFSFGPGGKSNRLLLATPINPLLRTRRKMWQQGGLKPYNVLQRITASFFKLTRWNNFSNAAQYVVGAQPPIKEEEPPIFFSNPINWRILASSLIGGWAPTTYYKVASLAREQPEGPPSLSDPEGGYDVEGQFLKVALQPALSFGPGGRVRSREPIRFWSLRRLLWQPTKSPKYAEQPIFLRTRREKMGCSAYFGDQNLIGASRPYNVLQGAAKHCNAPGGPKGRRAGGQFLKATKALQTFRVLRSNKVARRAGGPFIQDYWGAQLPRSNKVARRAEGPFFSSSINKGRRARTEGFFFYWLIPFAGLIFSRASLENLNLPLLDNVAFIASQPSGSFGSFYKRIKGSEGPRGFSNPYNVLQSITKITPTDPKENLPSGSFSNALQCSYGPGGFAGPKALLRTQRANKQGGGHFSIKNGLQSPFSFAGEANFGGFYPHSGLEKTDLELLCPSLSYNLPGYFVTKWQSYNSEQTINFFLYKNKINKEYLLVGGSHCDPNLFNIYLKDTHIPSGKIRPLYIQPFFKQLKSDFRSPAQKRALQTLLRLNWFPTEPIFKSNKVFLRVAKQLGAFGGNKVARRKICPPPSGSVGVTLVLRSSAARGLTRDKKKPYNVAFIASQPSTTYDFVPEGPKENLATRWPKALLCRFATRPPGPKDPEGYFVAAEGSKDLRNPPGPLQQSSPEGCSLLYRGFSHDRASKTTAEGSKERANKLRSLQGGSVGPGGQNFRARGIKKSLCSPLYEPFTATGADDPNSMFVAKFLLENKLKSKEGKVSKEQAKQPTPTDPEGFLSPPYIVPGGLKVGAFGPTSYYNVRLRLTLSPQNKVTEGPEGKFSFGYEVGKSSSSTAQLNKIFKSLKKSLDCSLNCFICPTKSYKPLTLLPGPSKQQSSPEGQRRGQIKGAVGFFTKKNKDGPEFDRTQKKEKKTSRRKSGVNEPEYLTPNFAFLDFGPEIKKTNFSPLVNIQANRIAHPVLYLLKNFSSIKIIPAFIPTPLYRYRYTHKFHINNSIKMINKKKVWFKNKSLETPMFFISSETILHRIATLLQTLKIRPLLRTLKIRPPGYFVAAEGSKDLRNPPSGLQSNDVEGCSLLYRGFSHDKASKATAEGSKERANKLRSLQGGRRFLKVPSGSFRPFYSIIKGPEDHLKIPGSEPGIFTLRPFYNRIKGYEGVRSRANFIPNLPASPSTLFLNTIGKEKKDKNLLEKLFRAYLYKGLKAKSLLRRFATRREKKRERQSLYAVASKPALKIGTGVAKENRVASLAREQPPGLLGCRRRLQGPSQPGAPIKFWSLRRLLWQPTKSPKYAEQPIFLRVRRTRRATLLPPKAPRRGQKKEQQKRSTLLPFQYNSFFLYKKKTPRSTSERFLSPNNALQRTTWRLRRQQSNPKGLLLYYKGVQSTTNPLQRRLKIGASRPQFLKATATHPEGRRKMWGLKPRIFRAGPSEQQSSPEGRGANFNQTFIPSGRLLLKFQKFYKRSLHSRSEYSKSANFPNNSLTERFILKNTKQKKRRVRKQRKQTLARKKRKRFYPRPIWLRFRMFLNFYTFNGKSIKNCENLDKFLPSPTNPKENLPSAWSLRRKPYNVAFKLQTLKIRPLLRAQNCFATLRIRWARRVAFEQAKQRRSTATHPVGRRAVGFYNIIKGLPCCRQSLQGEGRRAVGPEQIDAVSIIERFNYSISNAIKKDLSGSMTELLKPGKKIVEKNLEKLATQLTKDTTQHKKVFVLQKQIHLQNYFKRIKIYLKKLRNKILSPVKTVRFYNKRNTNKSDPQLYFTGQVKKGYKPQPYTHICTIIFGKKQQAPTLYNINSSSVASKEDYNRILYTRIQKNIQTNYLSSAGEPEEQSDCVATREKEPSGSLLRTRRVLKIGGLKPGAAPGGQLRSDNVLQSTTNPSGPTDPEGCEATSEHPEGQRAGGLLNQVVFYSDLKVNLRKNKKLSLSLIKESALRKPSSKDPQDTSPLRRIKDFKKKNFLQQIWISLYNTGNWQLCWGSSPTQFPLGIIGAPIEIFFGAWTRDLPNQIKQNSLSSALTKTNNWFFGNLATKAKIEYKNHNQNKTLWSVQKLKYQGKSNKTKYLQIFLNDCVNTLTAGYEPMYCTTLNNHTKKPKKSSKFDKNIYPTYSFVASKPERPKGRIRGPERRSKGKLHKKILQKWKIKEQKLWYLGWNTQKKHWPFLYGPCLPIKKDLRIATANFFPSRSEGVVQTFYKPYYVQQSTETHPGGRRAGGFYNIIKGSEDALQTPYFVALLAREQPSTSLLCNPEGGLRSNEGRVRREKTLFYGPGGGVAKQLFPPSPKEKIGGPNPQIRRRRSTISYIRKGKQKNWHRQPNSSLFFGKNRWFVQKTKTLPFYLAVAPKNFVGSIFNPYRCSPLLRVGGDPLYKIKVKYLLRTTSSLCLLHRGSSHDKEESNPLHRTATHCKALLKLPKENLPSPSLLCNPEGGYGVGPLPYSVAKRPRGQIFKGRREKKRASRPTFSNYGGISVEEKSLLSAPSPSFSPSDPPSGSLRKIGASKPCAALLRITLSPQNKVTPTDPEGGGQLSFGAFGGCFGNRRSLQKTQSDFVEGFLWSFYSFSLFFHFCSLISLISLFQIRCFLKFNFLVVFKLFTNSKYIVTSLLRVTLSRGDKVIRSSAAQGFEAPIFLNDPTSGFVGEGGLLRKIGLLRNPPGPKDLRNPEPRLSFGLQNTQSNKVASLAREQPQLSSKISPRDSIRLQDPNLNILYRAKPHLRQKHFYNIIKPSALRVRWSNFSNALQSLFPPGPKEKIGAGVAKENRVASLAREQPLGLLGCRRRLQGPSQPGTPIKFWSLRRLLWQPTKSPKYAEQPIFLRVRRTFATRRKTLLPPKAPRKGQNFRAGGQIKGAGDLNGGGPSNILLSNKILKHKSNLAKKIKSITKICKTGARFIVTFSKNPDVFINDFVANAFLVEWSSDLIVLIPENLEVLAWNSFNLFSQSAKTSLLFNFITLSCAGDRRAGGLRAIIGALGCEATAEGSKLLHNPEKDFVAAQHYSVPVKHSGVFVLGDKVTATRLKTLSSTTSLKNWGFEAPIFKSDCNAPGGPEGRILGPPYGLQSNEGEGYKSLHNNYLNKWGVAQASSIFIKIINFCVLQRIFASTAQEMAYSFIKILFQPDMDLIVRQKKGTIFWEIWADILTKAAFRNRFAISSLAILKEEQNSFIALMIKEGSFKNKSSSSGPKLNRPLLRTRRTIPAPIFWAGALQGLVTPIKEDPPSPWSLRRQQSLSPGCEGPWSLRRQQSSPKENLATRWPKALLRRFACSIVAEATIKKRATRPPGYFVAAEGSKDLRLLHRGSSHDKEESNPEKDFVADEGSKERANKLRSLQGLKSLLFSYKTWGRPRPQAKERFLYKRNIRGITGDKKKKTYGSEGEGNVDNDFTAEKENWAVNQFVTSMSKDTDLFLCYAPAKSFTHLNSSIYYNQVQQSLGFLTCSIYSGIFSKQQAKNILIIGTSSNVKANLVPSPLKLKQEEGVARNYNSSIRDISLLITALAGETELKIITDNANRYSLIIGGVAIGIRLLRDVFDALALHAPCLFLLENIHAIGERRPFLFSDSTNQEKHILSSGGTGTQLQIEEQNKIQSESAYHAIKHYKKPYKGEFSLVIPTNHFSFDLFRQITNNTISGITKKNPIKLPYLPASQFFGINESKRLQTTNSSLKFNISSRSKQIAPPATSPLNVLLIKEQKKFRPEKLVKELAFSPEQNGTGERLSQLPRYSYSVRTKVALLAESALSNMSAKLDMITDLLMIFDGVRTHRGFVVFATTDVPSILDPALRRPGRLDETIRVPKIPNIWSRWEILKTDLNLSNKNKGKPSPSPLLETLPYVAFIASQPSILLHRGSSHDKEESNPEKDFVAAEGSKERANQLRSLQGGSFATKSPEGPIREEPQSSPEKKKKAKSLLKRVTYLSVGKTLLNIYFCYKSSDLPQNIGVASLVTLFSAKPFLLKSLLTNLLAGKVSETFVFSSFSLAISPLLLNGATRWPKAQHRTTMYDFVPEGPKENLPFGLLSSKQSNRRRLQVASQPRGLLSSKQSNNGPRGLLSSLSWLEPRWSKRSNNGPGGSLRKIGASKPCAAPALQATLLPPKAPRRGQLRSDVVGPKALLRTRPPGCKQRANKLRSLQGEGLNFRAGPKEGKVSSKGEGVIRWSATQYSLNDSWQTSFSILLSLFQKRYMFNKNLIVPKLLDLGETSIINNRHNPESSPSSSILIPAKRYENYKRAKQAIIYGKKKMNMAIGEKIQVHQQKNLILRLYNTHQHKNFKLPFVASQPGALLRTATLLPSPTTSLLNCPPGAAQGFEAPIFSFGPGGKSDCNALLKLPEGRILGPPYGSEGEGQRANKLRSLQGGGTWGGLNFTISKSKYCHELSGSSHYFRQNILNRHRQYLTNQWCSLQLPEQNAYLKRSDLDWRYTFIPLIGDFLIDYPDAEQFYNTGKQRWIKTRGSWISAPNSNLFTNQVTSEIFEHYVFEAFIKTFNWLEKNREFLDYSAYKSQKKGSYNSF